MSRHTLLAYYSMGGNTRRVANELGEAVDADVEEIDEPRPRHGATGVLRALLDATLRRKAAIRPVRHDPADYDLLIMGGPVWGGRLAAPVRTYAERYGRRAPNVAFFCTEGGHGAETAYADLEALCQHSPETTLTVDAAHLPAPAHRAEMERFVRTTAGRREPETPTATGGTA